MSVLIFDTRTVLDQADVITAWNQGEIITTQFAESTGVVVLQVNIATDQLFWTGTAVDFTVAGDEMIYIWSQNSALQNSWNAGAASSHAMWLGDGTNSVVFFEAGVDRDVFKHSDTQVTFQCMVLDTEYAAIKDAAGETFESAGTFAALSLNALTQVGSYFVTLSKALGGGFNTFVDVIRYGSNGIVIHGGTEADPGTVLDIVTEDRSTADGRALGIIREYTAGAFGCQGTLQFGITGGSPVTGGSPSFSWFEDSNVSITFEDRDIGDDKLRFLVNGSSTGGEETHFILSNSTISSARPAVTVEMSGDGIDELFLTAVTFSQLRNPVFFPTDTLATGSPQGLLGNHIIINSTFNVCGMVDPGTTEFNNNTISNSTTFAAIGSPSGTLAGGLLIDADGTDNISDLVFTNAGSPGNHAIYISATGTYAFVNFTYSGYAVSDGSTGTEAVFNDSGGAVTINITGGDTPSVRDGAGASTTLVASVPVTVTVLDVAGDPIANAQTAVFLDSDESEIINADTNGSGVASGTFGGTTPAPVSVRVRKNSPGDTRYFPVNSPATITSTGLTLTVSLAEDTIAG